MLISVEKAILETLVKQGLGLRPIANELGMSPTNIRYWLRKYGLKLHQKPFGAGYVAPLRPHKCTVCGDTEPANFYGHKRKICGPCQNVYNTKRLHQSLDYQTPARVYFEK